MARSVAGLGIPGVVGLALARYLRRLGDLERVGVSGVAAEAMILEDARGAGGLPAEGETINLSLWSERLEVPRPVLEALVLSILRAEREVEVSTRRASSQAEPPTEPARGAEPWTPSPHAMRSPPVAGPALEPADVFEPVPAFQEYGYVDCAHHVACFTFPDEATQARCLEPLHLGATRWPGSRRVVLGGIAVQAHAQGLSLAIRLDPEGTSNGISAGDTARARRAGEALAGLELLGFRVRYPPPRTGPND